MQRLQVTSANRSAVIVICREFCNDVHMVTLDVLLDTSAAVWKLFAGKTIRFPRTNPGFEPHSKLVKYVISQLD